MRNGKLCDVCDEWNHFHCVNITKHQISDKNIKSQYPTCIEDGNIVFGMGETEECVSS